MRTRARIFLMTSTKVEHYVDVMERIDMLKEKYCVLMDDLVGKSGKSYHPSRDLRLRKASIKVKYFYNREND